MALVPCPNWGTKSARRSQPALSAFFPSALKETNHGLDSIYGVRKERFDSGNELPTLLNQSHQTLSSWNRSRTFSAITTTIVELV